jgi:hypothetical protein
MSVGSGIGMGMSEGTVEQRLKEQRKAAEPVDRSGFESRHSGPRDPTSGHGETDLDGREKVSEQAVGSGGEGKGDGSTAVAKDRGAGENVGDECVHPRRGSGASDRISFMRYVPSPPPDEKAHRRVLSFVGVGAHPNSTAYQLPRSGGMLNRMGKKAKDSEQAVEDAAEGLSSEMYPHYLTRHTTGRNAQFFGLTRAEREHLGGVEYRAITLLAWVVPIYFVLWQLLGCLGLAAYMAHNKAATARGNGINPW